MLRMSHKYTTKYLSKPYFSTADLGINASTWPISTNPVGLYVADVANLTIDGSNNVTVWNDISGQGNHLSTVSSTKPVYHSDVTVNNNPTVLFGGSAWISKSWTITTPSTYFVVGKINSYTQWTALIGGATSYTWAICQHGGSGYISTYCSTAYGGTDIASPVGSWALWSLIGNTTAVLCVNNGTPQNETGGSPNSGGLAIGSMGQTGPGSYNINAYIREVAVVPGALGSTDMATMKAYYNTKYSLY